MGPGIALLQLSQGQEAISISGKNLKTTLVNPPIPEVSEMAHPVYEWSCQVNKSTILGEDKKNKTERSSGDNLVTFNYKNIK